MLSAILMKTGVALGGILLTGLGANIGLRILNRLNWEGFYTRIEDLAYKVSALANIRLTSAFYEPFETFFQGVLTEAVARINKGLDRDDKKEESPNAEKPA